MAEQAFSWRCPYCNQIATVLEQNGSESLHFFDHNNKEGLQDFGHR